MSSNRNNKENRPSKKMTSIARRLEWHLFRTKFRIYITQDILLYIFLVLGWAIMKEVELVGDFDINRKLYFAFPDGFRRGVLQIAAQDGTLLASIAFFDIMVAVAAVVGVLFLFQFVGVMLSLFGEARRIHNTLTPIYEIAEKADELNRLTFSEDKYQLIEKALDKVDPDDNKHISLGDRELQGIESAVNSLVERLKDSYRQQARFVNDASHELRTPIAVIQGYANMLERWGSSDEKVLEESIAAITHEADHMNKLVEQLLFLARGDSGKTVLNKERVVLNDLMQEIYEESFMIDEAHPYRFKNPDGEIAVYADPTLLKQAVRILIDNAAKYTKEKDEIILGLGRTSDMKPYLMVQDTGIGMTQQDVEHMFERFYRADEARSFTGTGLGLSIAKWIVDKHGGHFEVVSRTELGTRIMIVLQDEA